MTERGWHSYIGKDVTPEMRARIAASQSKAMATIEIRIYSTKPNDSEVSIAVSPHGSFADFQGTDAADSQRSAAANNIYGVAARELRTALSVLSGM